MIHIDHIHIKMENIHRLSSHFGVQLFAGARSDGIVRVREKKIFPGGVLDAPFPGGPRAYIGIKTVYPDPGIPACPFPQQVRCMICACVVDAENFNITQSLPRPAYQYLVKVLCHVANRYDCRYFGISHLGSSFSHGQTITIESRSVLGLLTPVGETG